VNSYRKRKSRDTIRCFGRQTAPSSTLEPYSKSLQNTQIPQRGTRWNCLCFQMKFVLRQTSALAWRQSTSGRISNYTAYSSMAVKLFFFILKSVKASFVSDSESVPILCNPISKLYVEMEFGELLWSFSCVPRTAVFDTRQRYKMLY